MWEISVTSVFLLGTVTVRHQLQADCVKMWVCPAKILTATKGRFTTEPGNFQRIKGL